jgi:hypothetical protein
MTDLAYGGAVSSPNSPVGDQWVGLVDRMVVAGFSLRHGIPEYFYKNGLKPSGHLSAATVKWLFFLLTLKRKKYKLK